MNPKDGHLFKRKGSPAWQLRIYVPTDVQADVGRKEIVESTRTSDWAEASGKAGTRLTEKRLEWDALRHGGVPIAASQAVIPTEDQLHIWGSGIYARSRKFIASKRGRVQSQNPTEYLDFLMRQEARQPGLVREMTSGNLDRWADATGRLLEKDGFTIDRKNPDFAKAAEICAEAMIAAIDVENRRDRGQLSAKPSSAMLDRADALASESADMRHNVAFSDLTEAFMRQWRAGMAGGKNTNTAQQKLATFRLFGGFWQNNPIRDVKAKDAAEFYDTIKLFDPNWSRSPTTRELAWDSLLDRFGNREVGLSDATMNRHIGTLQSLWNWAQKRGHCEGHNPFDGLYVKLREGVNVATYMPWDDDDFEVLFNPPSKRADLREVMIVAMFTGMRLDEIASLTWGKVRTEGVGDAAISYFEVTDAKTPAGWRQVPVHPSLAWLLSRRSGSADRLWPNFNLEGVGKKAGADASKLFSDFKIARGFATRKKTFHSFRKNVTRIMERAGVPENEWAQVFGHERGFTYGTYNPDGITLGRKADIIALIEYPGVSVPHPDGA